jgi:Rps23 Pro-64 3,4-dihydroxylase Tpa1-like proline 4-hydroxylase
MQYFEVKNFPIVVIDNFYPEHACEKIWDELTFLTNDNLSKLGDSKKIGSAVEVVDGEEQLLKKNKGVWVDELYQDRALSNILSESNLIFSLKLSEELLKKHIFFRYHNICNSHATLFQYYEDSDYYKPHKDNSVLTAISWFYKNPKSFTGGDIIIENELKIECGYNRLIIFPSILLHEVTEINMINQNREKNCGRFTITTFLKVA